MLFRNLTLISLLAGGVYAAPVTWKDGCMSGTTGRCTIIENGILRAQIWNATGELTSLQLRGVELIEQTATVEYNSHHYTYHQLEGTKLGMQGITNAVRSVSGDANSVLDFKFRMVWDGSASKYPVDIDMHYAMKANDSAIYNYSVLHHKPSYAALDIGFWRTNFWPRTQNPGSAYNFFDWFFLDSLRTQRDGTRDEMIAIAPTNITEIQRYTKGSMRGKFAGKYSQSADLRSLDAWGWASSTQKTGFFVVQAGKDWYGGGPLKQDLTWGILLPQSGHYDNDAGFNIAQGKEWRKVYGPWLFYANTGATPQAMYEDAKKRASVEQSQWPYSWVTDTSYKAAQRGLASGRIVINDPLKPTVTGAGSWVGLVPYDPDVDKAVDTGSWTPWEGEYAGHQYWQRADAVGNFTIPAVRPGKYHFFTWTPGQIGHLHKGSVVISPKAVTSLGTITRTIERKNRTFAWELGIADRKSSEFRGSQDFFKGFNWNNYHKLFPTPLVYTVGKSDWRKDWNYVQDRYSVPPVDEYTTDSTWSSLAPASSAIWPWQVKFTVGALRAKDTAILTVATAAANSPLTVELDGKLVHSEARLVTNPTSVLDGNILLRQSDHGIYHVNILKIPTEKLPAGEHTMTFTALSGGANAYLMYDYIGLEVPAVNTAPKMTIGASRLDANDFSKGFKLFANTISDADNNLSHVEYFVNNVYVGRGTNSATKFALDYTKVVWNSSYAVRAVAVDKLGATGASNSFSIATPKPFSYNLLPLNSGTELYARFALPTTKPASLTLEVVQYNALGALLGTWSQTYTSGFATGANRLCFQSKFPKKHTGTNFVMKLKSGSTLLASTSSFAL